MEEVFLLILGGDEAEAAIGDDLLDGTGGHKDLQHFPNHREKTHGLFEKEIDHAEHRHAVRRVPTIPHGFGDSGRSGAIARGIRGDQRMRLNTTARLIRW